MYVITDDFLGGRLVVSIITIGYKNVKNLTAKDLHSGCLLNLGDSLVTYINFERKNHMEVDKKIKKIERIYSKLQNENRDNESYMDDLLYCFIECWSIKEWLKNDIELQSKFTNINSKVEQYAKHNHNIQLCFDIANREKHLELKPNLNRVDGKISNSKIGVHLEDHITASIANITIKLIHVDDINEHDSKQNTQIESKEKTYNPTVEKTFITQEYEVTDNSGNRFNAMIVLGKAIDSWKDFIQKELK